jgi:hypothetical protein
LFCVEENGPYTYSECTTQGWEQRDTTCHYTPLDGLGEKYGLVVQVLVRIVLLGPVIIVILIDIVVTVLVVTVVILSWCCWC